jgi:hypothetical protein
LRHGTPEGGWANEIRPEDCIHTLVFGRALRHGQGRVFLRPLSKQCLSADIRRKRPTVPLLPLAFLPVAFALDRARASRKALAVLLATAGLAVQIGGVAIYFGAQMREAGDYPYTRPLSDPHFMSESHFNPRFSPIAGHWRMLVRNACDHVARRGPTLSGGDPVDPRVGVGARDQQALLRALDFWWLYARYAGVPGLPVFAALAALLFAAGWSWLKTLSLAADEASPS